MKTRTCILATSLIAVITAVAAPTDWEQNWPQWRGPLARGVAPSATPPRDWSETNNIRWKVAVPGSGTATPAIWGDQVFVLTAIKKPKAAETKAVENTNTPTSNPGQSGVRESTV